MIYCTCTAEDDDIHVHVQLTIIKMGNNDDILYMYS